MLLKSKVVKEVLTNENKSIIVLIGDTLELISSDINNDNYLVKFVNDDNFVIKLGSFYMSREEVEHE